MNLCQYLEKNILSIFNNKTKIKWECVNPYKAKWKRIQTQKKIFKAQFPPNQPWKNENEGKKIKKKKSTQV